MLNEADPQFGRNIQNAIHKVLNQDPFHVSANTDPKGGRSKSLFGIVFSTSEPSEEQHG